MRKDPEDIDVHAILNDLKEAIWHELPLQATIKCSFNEYTKEWYYGIVVGGAFSKKDINKIDEVAKKHDVYYEFGNEGLLVSVCIRYSYNDNAAQQTKSEQK
jgi:hypothetical protein